jgi:6-phosphogluconolactonase
VSNRTINLFNDTEALSQAAAEMVIATAQQAIRTRGRFAIALAGGSTPLRLYQLLADKPYHEQVPWPRVEFFWGDERTVPPDHPDSNFRMANEALLHKLVIPACNLHRMQGERADPHAAARDYEADLRRAFGLSSAEVPVFDLILLGMGPDGHTASLFPRTAALNETTRWVVANHVPQKDTWRLTLSKPVINQAAKVLFLVAGADKAAVLAEVLDGPPDPERLPSQSIQPVGGELHWFVTADAAAQLQRTVE